MRHVRSSVLALLSLGSLAWWVTSSTGDGGRRQAEASPRPTRGQVFFPARLSSMRAYAPPTRIEEDTAGFHLLPPRNVDRPRRGLATASGPFSTLLGGHRFWFAETRQPATHAGPFGVPQAIAWLSVDRIWANDAVVLHKVRDGAAWSLSMTFTERCHAEVLAQLGEAATDEAGMDWFGPLRAAGEPRTELRVALVVRQRALMPVSVTDMVAAGDSRTATIATDLTEAEADDIIALYTSG